MFVSASNVIKDDTGAQSVAAGQRITLSFTVTAASVDKLEIYMSGSSAATLPNFISLSCSNGGEDQGSSETSTETTSKAVTSAVARSQTSVIQQNIGARVATVIGSAGAGTVGTGNAGSPGGAGSATGGVGGTTGAEDSSSFTQFAFVDQINTLDDSDSKNRDVMRQLAMRSSFDSSVLAADFARESALALGPTDQGAVGGASGVDGRAALVSTSPITVWGHGSYTSVDNDYNNGTDDNRYDGDVWGYNLGADYRFADNLIAGLSLGYNDTDLTTTFNNGSYEETAWVVSPYAIFSPIENLNLVVEAGYSQGDVDVTRDNDTVRGSTDSAMWYGSVKGVYAYRPMETAPLTLSPSVSLLAARKTIDSYTESDGTFVASSRSNTRQFKPAIEAAYDFSFTSLIVTPFVETGMVYDFTDELNNDKTAFNIGGGVRLSDSSTGLNAALEGSYLAGRSDYTEYTFAGTVSYGFELRDLEGKPVGLMTPFVGSDVDEYGNQSMRGGLGFDTGPMQSRLSLARDISQGGNAESIAQVSMSLAF
ncbi:MULTISPECIES: autotransporter outer membrane beta-barrel domain-containing protein [Thalassospira]|nr:MULTISPECIES: autotransporter outer membrane beta-barrel domain-containing protein [Thalassospira]MDG4719064.1 autotransporter outer membrane beta-barrel domain-containing protein [Thalassospira sp. FZY0004]